jgi:uncharacterized protein
MNEPPAEDAMLYRQQQELSAILESGLPYAAVMQALQQSGLANTAWHIEQWHPDMLETAMEIARKWRR